MEISSASAFPTSPKVPRQSIGTRRISVDGKPQGGELALLGHELRAHARTPGELAALTGPELDVVDGRPDRDVAQGEGVAGADLGPLAAAQHVTDPHVARGEDVTLLAVEVVQQGDAGIAVGVVLDRWRPWRERRLCHA